MKWRREHMVDGGAPVSVQVWAPHALFARPEFRAEKVTYPVMTPSAARGVLNAILGKPEFEWWPVAIEVLAPIRQATLTRNEFFEAVVEGNAAAGRPLLRVGEDGKSATTQRSALVLRDVAYRIHAQPLVAEYARQESPCRHPGNPHGTHPGKNANSYREQFTKRVRRGACFSQPYLGAREFSAAFGPVDDTPAIEHSEDLGVMIHSTRPAWSNPHHEAGGNPTAGFEWFRARLDQGVMWIPRHGDYATTL